MALSGKLQEMFDQIGAIRERVLTGGSGLSELQENYRPARGGWTIREIFHHLALTDDATSRLFSNFLKQVRAGEVPADPSPQESMLTCMDHVFEQLTGRFQAPERVTPHDALPLKQSFEKLAVSRRRIYDTLEQLSGYDLTRLVFPHPVAGDLNAYQWLLMAGAHEKRHGAQVKQIKSEDNFPAT